MAEFEPSYVNHHLSVVGQGLSDIPPSLSQDFPDTKELDLSFNDISVVNNLEGFTKLRNLVLDNNSLSSQQDFPVIETLDTLWVNSNKIDDIVIFITQVEKSFPNLTYLSMLKNPACPNFFTGKEQEDYQRYRYYVLYRLPKLKFLDSSPVSAAELKEAARVGHLMVVARPAPSEYDKASSSSDAPGEDIRGLPQTLRTPGQAKASFGVTKYVYFGRQSEGNRFIMNSDL